jgi:hypothetical protein
MMIETMPLLTPRRPRSAARDNIALARQRIWAAADAPSLS